MPHTSGSATRDGRRYSGLDAAERTRQRHRALLDAALELFGTRGYSTSSVKHICTQADLTERYFYESFRDRHACLIALYGQLTDELRAATTTAVDGAAALDIDEIIERALTAFVTYLTADPRRARVVLLEVVGVSAELEQRRHTVLREFAELTTAVAFRGAETDTPTDTRRMTAVGLVGAVNHLLVDWLHRGRHETASTLVDICASLFSAARHRLDTSRK